MSNIKRHFRRRNLKTNLPLGATNIEKHQHKNHPKVQRYWVVPLHRCEFKINFGDFGFADMPRLSHCILEKLMQTCFRLKTSFYWFSLTLTQWGACQKIGHIERLLSFLFPTSHWTFLSPFYQPLPPSLYISFVFSASPEISPSWLFSWLDLLRNRASEKCGLLF